MSPAPVHPSHITATGPTYTTGIDLARPCRCTDAALCPCQCHLRAVSVARIADAHRRFHVTPAEWCPACRAIAGPPRMMPGQTPYTPDEWSRLAALVHDAAAGDPGEENE